MAVLKRTTHSPPGEQDPQPRSDTKSPAWSTGATWPTKLVRRQRRASQGERNRGVLPEKLTSRRPQRRREERGGAEIGAGPPPTTTKVGFGRWLFPWLRCLLVAWVYVVALKVVSAAGEVAVIALFVIPAIITTLYLPSSRRRSWRWL